jgi:hypothetical protein
VIRLAVPIDDVFAARARMRDRLIAGAVFGSSAASRCRGSSSARSRSRSRS